MTGPRPKHGQVVGALMFPHDYARRIYAMGLSDGGVKVGQSRNPRRRTNELARQYRQPILWAHVFGQSFVRTTDALKVERAAALMLSRVGRQRGNTEVFEGVTRDDVLRCVRAAIASAGEFAKPAQG